MKKTHQKHTDTYQHLVHAETTAVMGRVLVDQLDRLSEEIATLKKVSVFLPRLAAIRAAAELMVGGKHGLSAMSNLSPVRKKRRRRRKKKVAKGE